MNVSLVKESIIKDIGCFVVGLVEPTAKRRILLASVERIDIITLSRLIKKHVVERSIVYTDCWRG